MGVLRRLVVGVSSALFAAGLAAAGASAAPRAPQPHIDALDVERVESLAPGTRLNFSLFGTAGGSAWLQIDGAQRALELRELQPGIYDGSHVIDARDRIGAHARVVATLRIGERSTQALLAEPLLLGVEARAPAATPAGPPVMTLPAERPGAALPADSPPAPMALPPPVVLPPPFTRPSPAAAPSLCDDCARVESIRRIEPEGAASGGLIATLFGERVANELDRHFARLQAPLDRAVGRQRAGPRHEVVLRLASGERLLRSYEQAPAFKVGDIVPLGPNLGGARSERLLDEPASTARREP
ncbi:hypothetical protein [Aquabacterium humicola]|uniref:hypothetical protein n=1 Tax=Aquabacterium humicola TaxID=3237377 RepID=UPI002542B7EE|nr:hypothetical protein [Rubrivivax pictus]